MQDDEIEFRQGGKRKLRIQYGDRQTLAYTWYPVYRAAV